MRFLSMCSGIEAASVAWGPLGWRAAGFAEIEPFPCAVLAHHYPSVPNLGDMTKFEEWPDLGPVDLLCGGTPCQSFSVAGLRAGLADPRGNLMLTFGAIAAKHRPRWLVWENVPGVLSSNGGRDFGAFLGLLGELGYGFAYRVLDAQFFGLAQRRKRVFVVGCLGDWRRAAAVLFERHGLSGHPAPSRQAGQRVANRLVDRPDRGGGNSEGQRLIAFGGNNTGGPIDVATARNACASASGRMDFESETFLVTHALTGEGFDASEGGTGRGTPLVPVRPIVFDTTQITSKTNRCQPKAGDPCHPLAAGAHPPAIAFNARQDPINGPINGPIDTDGSTSAVLTFQERGREGGRSLDVGGDLAFALTAPNGGGRAQERNIAAGMQVRRLTPRECERLQGFADDYTLILHRGKPAADGPRYKALGNSWAVPVAAWIGRRIEAVEAISLQEAA